MKAFFPPMKCRDCGFVDKPGELDKCPYCKSDDWVKVKKPKKKAKK